MKVLIIWMLAQRYFVKLPHLLISQLMVSSLTRSLSLSKERSRKVKV